jgi:hypothetical protein
MITTTCTAAKRALHSFISHYNLMNILYTAENEEWWIKTNIHRNSCTACNIPHILMSGWENIKMELTIIGWKGASMFSTGLGLTVQCQAFLNTRQGICWPTLLSLLIVRNSMLRTYTVPSKNVWEFIWWCVPWEIQQRIISFLSSSLTSFLPFLYHLPSFFH